MFIPFSHLMNNKRILNDHALILGNMEQAAFILLYKEFSSFIQDLGGGNKLYFVASYRLAVFHKKDGKNFK